MKKGHRSEIHQCKQRENGHECVAIQTLDLVIVRRPLSAKEGGINRYPNLTTEALGLSTSVARSPTVDIIPMTYSNSERTFSKHWTIVVHASQNQERTRT